MGTSKECIIREQGRKIRDLKESQARLLSALSGATGYIGFLAGGFVQDAEVRQGAMARCVGFRKLILEVKGQPGG